MKLISVDDGEHFNKAAQSGSPSEMLPPSMPPPAPSTNKDKRSGVIVNGTGHVDGTADKRPPPIPSRAPTTSLSSRPKDARMSVTGMDTCEQGLNQNIVLAFLAKNAITNTITK